MKFNITENPANLEVEIDFSVEQDLKSFNEEVLNTLYFHHQSNTIEKILLSDGMDSTFISLCLKELDIQINPLSFVFESLASEVMDRIKYFCNLINVKPNFFVIKEKEFFKYVDFLVYEKRIAYPVLNGFYMSYILDTFQENFFTGISCEFKYYENKFIDVGMVTPYLLKRNYPNRLFGFANSRTFLSYVNHLKFIENKNLQENLSNPLYIRNLIYTEIYPNLPKYEKGPWFDDNIRKIFHQKYYFIKKEIPWVFQLKNYRFNVHEYFNSKDNKLV